VIAISLCILSNLCIYALFKNIKSDSSGLKRIIILNYLVAGAMGATYIPALTSHLFFHDIAFWPLIGVLLLGVLFILLFRLMAIITQESGVTVASAATKMSFAVSTVVSLWIFKEQLELLHWMAWSLSLVAVYLILISGKPDFNKAKGPLILLIGSAVIEILLNILQREVPEALHPALTSGIFIVAAVLGIAFGWLRKIPSAREITQGVMLGAANYFSIYTLITALNSNAFKPGFVLVLINAGVLCGGMLLGIAFYRERPGLQAYLGIALAIVGMVLAIW
jgi:drug/metabolite transporter (DMT)-like permease